jgi:hypothetical protein
VAAVNAACAACDYSVMGEMVPDLIGELHPLAEANGGEAWRLLAEVLHAAFYLSKDLGHGDLAWMVSGHLHRAVESTGDPVWEALSAFVRGHAVVGLQARQRGLTLAECGAELVHPDGAEAGQVHGMLHLSAALQAAVLNKPRAVSGAPGGGRRDPPPARGTATSPGCTSAPVTSGSGGSRWRWS